MRGGNMDLRLEIQRAVQTRSRSGDVKTDGWVKVGEVWAEQMSVKAAERYLSQQVVAEAEIAFRMREWPGPTLFGPEERFRLLDGGTPQYVSAVMQARGRRSNGGFVVLASSRREITRADGAAVGEE
ncbi:hypothetical protein TMCBR2_gp009 [Caulobacter phage TMCBR2]|uniref:Head-tail adaptor protein n=3 Tax=Kronosvirus TaxID=3425745 RepID=A0A386KSW6_9CAUD|nr:hypothetical protein [Caulobacter phage Kronos]WCS66494.1 hypothetical protein TMCBR2_gp009 [Caulobacter phage TMCBR2]WDS38257.1 hypothetical protein TMCBR3_gp009 [Caulobacter phage TMCBR3]WDS38318.1 hypothetical protein TMCBR4_gp009 [Caulobacter phage TMCBR4]WDS38377.1 hypothetical protein W2_gp009 [Caulobacter phage W2]